MKNKKNGSLIDLTDFQRFGVGIIYEMMVDLGTK